MKLLKGVFCSRCGEQMYGDRYGIQPHYTAPVETAGLRRAGTIWCGMIGRKHQVVDIDRMIDELLTIAGS